MVEDAIEAVLGAPEERDEVVVQLFVKDGGQWGEMYRDAGEYWIEIYGVGERSLRVRCDTFLQSLTRYHAELRRRLEG